MYVESKARHRVYFIINQYKADGFEMEHYHINLLYTLFFGLNVIAMKQAVFT